MYIVYAICSLLLFWTSGINAQYTTSASQEVTLCTTAYGPSSVANPPRSTSTTIDSITTTITTTFTPIRLITPVAATVSRTIRTFETSYIFTTPPKKGTATTTYTFYSTATLVLPKVTRTTGTLSTFSTDLRVSLTMNGGPTFPYAPDTLPGATPLPAAKKRSPRPEKVEVDLEPRQNAAATYAQRVSCLVISKRANIVVVKATAATSRVTLAQNTYTTQVAETVTTISTEFNPSPTAVTEKLATTTFTTTRTPVDTFTINRDDYTIVTSIGPFPRYYTQCASQNGVQKVSGTKVQGYDPASPTGQNQIRANVTYLDVTATECCGLCIEDSNCAASYKFSQVGATGCSFIYRSNNVCNAANPLLLRAIIYDDSDPNGHPTGNSVWNNKCGKFVESGPRSA